MAVALGWLAISRNGGNAPKVTLDERTGAYRGVRFGTSADAVIRMFGEPARTPGFAPAGQSPPDVGVPQSIPGPGELLKYDDVAFLTGPRGVYALIVADVGATTQRGVSVGHRMDEGRGEYGLECIDVAGGESPLGQEFYPSCRADLEGGVRIWFGHDPIRSITLLSISHTTR